MATYCLSSDLLLGDLGTSASQDPSRFISDGGMEIEQRLGHRYIIPFDVNILPQISVITLKRINVYLATGGFMVSAYAGGTNEHKTGLYYLKNAREALEALANGSAELPGAPLQPAFADSGSGPLVSNVDASSMVEDYYNSDALGGNPVNKYPYLTERPAEGILIWR